MGEARQPQSAAAPLGQAWPWLVLAVLIFSVGMARLWPLTIDDAFISARYARNLVHGYGLAYNPGDSPSEGFSNLTMVLLTAGCVRLGAEAITAAKAIAALCGLLCLLFAALAAKMAIPRHYHFAVLLCATSFPLLLWSTAGLETSLMALLAALWMYLGMRLLVLSDRRGLWGLAAVTVLAALTRPEGLLFVPATAALLWRARATVRVSWWGLVAAAVVLALHEAWRVFYFGHLLPLPFYAKVEVGSALAKLSGAYYLHAFLWSYGGGIVAYLALLYAWVKRRDTEGQAGYVALLTLAPFLVFVLAVGADWMPQFRFLVPVIVPLSILVVGLLGGLEEALAQAAPQVVRLLIAGSLAALLLGNAAAAWRARQREEWHSTKMERLDIHQGASVALREQGLWLHDHGGSKLTVAAMDIGAPGYYSDAHIIDMHGLTNPDVAGKSREAVADYVLSRHPDYIQTYGHPIQDRPEFKRDYVVAPVPWNLYARRR